MTLLTCLTRDPLDKVHGAQRISFVFAAAVMMMNEDDVINALTFLLVDALSEVIPSHFC